MICAQYSRLAAALLAAGLISVTGSAAASDSGVVISQVYGGGGNTGATYTHDFIELFNAGATPVSLGDWSLQYASAAGTGNFGANLFQLTELPNLVLPPGQYLLVQQAQGSGGTTSLPSPDVIDPTPIALSATGGKVVLVNTTTSLGCNGSSTSCSTAALAQIIDLVGYGNANFFEGSGATPAPSNTTAVLRSGNGCTDTNNNSSDFVTGAPIPRNTASPLNPCANANQPVSSTCPAAISTVFGAEGNGPVAAADPDGVVNSAVITTGAVAGITLQAVNPAAMIGGTLTAVLDVAGSVAVGSYPLTLTFTNTDPTPQTASCTITVNVSAPPVGATRIHDLQGSGHRSPLEGANVAAVPGIVTALSSNGFYLQDPTPDNDPATSEGIFVFTHSAPTVTVGDSVLVSGQVTEFRPGGASGTDNLTITEITGPIIVTVSTGNPLPAPIIIGAGGRIPPSQVIKDGNGGSVELSSCPFDANTNGIDFYESLEGMRVRIDNAVAVGPTNAFGEIPVIGDNGVNATGRSRRGGLVIAPDDFNPERVILDDALTALPAVNVGDMFPSVTGVLDYSFGNFKLLVTQPPTAVPGGLDPEQTTLHGSATALTIASFNVENLDPGDGATKFDALARQIVNNLQAPDLIGLMEVQDNNGATNDATVAADLTLNTLIAAIQQAGGPTYQYRQINPVDDQDGGEPSGNIRVAFLFNPIRLTFVDRAGGTATAAVAVVAGADGPQLSFSPGRIDPTNPAFVNSRKPLAGEFRFNGHRLFIIANHFNSKGGDQPLFGQFQPPQRVSEVQRGQQATVVADFVLALLAQDANTNIVVLGDLNDFEFSAAVQRLKIADLHDLVETLPGDERYTYVFEGNSQVLDHILVSDHLRYFGAADYDVVHVNAEFATQISDHDPEVARFTLPPLVVPVTGQFNVRLSGLVYNRKTRQYSGTIGLTNQGATLTGPVQVELTDLIPGITLVNTNGTHAGNPYITLPGGVAADATVSVPVRFTIPAGVNLSYTVQVWSGPF